MRMGTSIPRFATRFATRSALVMRVTTSCLPPGRIAYRTLSLASLSALLVISTGCGSGAYEAKYKERVDKVTATSNKVRTYAGKLAKLDSPTPFPHASATIRLPAGMRTPQAGWATSEPPFPFRSPFTRFEGMQNMEDESQLPFYVYLSIDVDADLAEGAEGDPETTSATGGLEQTQQMLLEQLRKKFPDVPTDATWETIDAPTPGQFGLSDQATIPWHCLQLKAPQEILVLTPENKNERQALDAELEVCVHEFDGFRAIVVFQVPEGVDSAFQLEEMRPIILGTIDTQAQLYTPKER